MFDAHCRLHFAQRRGALDQAADRGITGVVLADYDGTRRSEAAFRARRSGVWATAGLDPRAVVEFENGRVDESLQRLEEELEAGDWCAVGTIGLDYRVATTQKRRRRQQRVFAEQLQLARRFDLPVVVHARRCHNSLLRMLRSHNAGEIGGIVRDFTGSPRQVGPFLMHDFDLSFGPSLAAGSERARRAVEQVAKNRLIVESGEPEPPVDDTDLDYRGPEKIVEMIASIRGVDAERIADRTERNVRRRLGLDDEVLTG